MTQYESIIYFASRMSKEDAITTIAAAIELYCNKNDVAQLITLLEMNSTPENVINVDFKIKHQGVKGLLK